MFVFLVLFWPAYNKGQKSKSNARVEFIDGVECIHNTGTPLHPDKTVTFVKDLSIGEENEAGNVILLKPRLALVDNNENIYFIELLDQDIKVFNSDGMYIKIIGAKGSGPGEFQNIGSLAITEDGTLLVMDQTLRRTSLFDTSGQFLRSFQWRASCFSLIIVKKSSYIVSAIDYSNYGPFGELFIKEVDFNGNEIRFPGIFSAPVGKILRDGKYSHFIIPPVIIMSGFVGDPNRGIFYHCVNDKYIIEVYNASGKLLKKIDRPYKPVPFNENDAQEYRAKYGNLGSEFIKKAVEEMDMPKVKSIVEGMYTDDEGKLWIKTNEKQEDNKKSLTAFDVFDSDGNYFAKVWLADIPLIFKKGKMYRMDTDQETGYQSLKRYKVIWK